MRINVIARALLLMLTILIILANAIDTIATSGKWVTCPSISSTSQLYSVYFSDHNHGWVVGNEGTILHTFDGGKKWTNQISGTKELLWSVFFIDSMIGYVAGGTLDLEVPSTILKTTDGGSTWKSQKSPTTAGLTGVFFTDKNHGWIVGAKNNDKTLSGVILSTSDGGQKWIIQHQDSTERYFALHFLNQQVGWVAGDNGRVLKTIDGGVSWSANRACDNSMLRSIDFTDANQGWAVGYPAVIVHTSDGGNTWQTKKQTGLVPSLASVSFVDAENGWTVCDMGKPIVLVTKNGGETWIKQVIKFKTDLWLNRIYFLDQAHGWAVGESSDGLGHLKSEILRFNE